MFLKRQKLFYLFYSENVRAQGYFLLQPLTGFQSARTVYRFNHLREETFKKILILFTSFLNEIFFLLKGEISPIQ